MHTTIVVDASVWVSRLIRLGANYQASQQWLETFEAKGGRAIAGSKPIYTADSYDDKNVGLYVTDLGQGK